MIIFISTLLKDIFKQGRNFPWPMPAVCPRCGCSKVWGHGYVSAWFDGFSEALLLKRYRCPCCGCVIRMRPDSHFSRFQASIHNIRSTLSTRIKTGRWPPDQSGPRPGHWLRSLKRKAFALLDNRWKGDLIKAFDHLVIQNHNPVSRSI